MKKLLIIRHAKSDWDNPRMPDFDRPLNQRGERNAPEMAERLLKKNLIPDLMISSPARRAITTAAIFGEVLGFKKKDILQEEAIYEASAQSLLRTINKFDNQHQFIAMFGHNPGLTDLALNLCECDIYNLPTCGVIMFEFPFDDWKMVSNGTAVLKFYDYPKKEVVD